MNSIFEKKFEEFAKTLDKMSKKDWRAIENIQQKLEKGKYWFWVIFLEILKKKIRGIFGKTSGKF